MCERIKKTPEEIAADKRAWALANPEKMKASRQKWADANKEKVCASQKQRLSDPENRKKHNAICKRYRDSHKEYYRERCSQWSKNNRARVLARTKAWQSVNREKHLKQRKEWRLANIISERERNRGKKRTPEIRAWERMNRKRKMESDSSFVMKERLRTRIRVAIRSQSGMKAKRTMELLGCSIESLRMLIESKFEPDMTWENWGPVWHIDHIIPCAIFDLTKESHQRVCFHFSNLQPLFVYDNLKKSDSVPEGFVLTI